MAPGWNPAPNGASPGSAAHARLSVSCEALAKEQVVPAPPPVPKPSGPPALRARASSWGTGRGLTLRARGRRTRCCAAPRPN